jgi:DNA-binding IclR family transcriptional regulator
VLVSGILGLGIWPCQASKRSIQGGALTDVSNPTSRVLDVLNFLGAHPTESFTLAEIARHLGLSNGSAHRILTTMAESRFLSRNEKHKTYSLGIALVALGRAALEKHRGIEIARKEIAQLALELNAQCSVTAIADGELLLVAKEGAPQSHDGLHQVGERTPLILPFAIGHIAWSSEQVIESYLSEASPYLSKALRKHTFAAISAIRRRGYAMAANGPAMRGLRQSMISPNGYIGMMHIGRLCVTRLARCQKTSFSCSISRASQPLV